MPESSSNAPLTPPKTDAGRSAAGAGDLSQATPASETAEVELIWRKAKDGEALTVEEKLVLFDANTARIDRLRAREIKDELARGTRITRENRGWTREDLYEDRIGRYHR